MKCPSCGVWNRAHFTKCFRCGAELTDAAKPENDIIEPEFYDEEPVTAVLTPVEEEPQTAEVPEVVMQEEEDELEVYSLYDNGAKACMGNFAAFSAIPGVDVSKVFFEPIDQLVAGSLTIEQYAANIKAVNDQMRNNLLG